jgi:hypothetical protein
MLLPTSSPLPKATTELLVTNLSIAASAAALRLIQYSGKCSRSRSSDEKQYCQQHIKTRTLQRQLHLRKPCLSWKGESFGLPAHPQQQSQLQHEAYLLLSAAAAALTSNLGLDLPYTNAIGQQHITVYHS